MQRSTLSLFYRHTVSEVMLLPWNAAQLQKKDLKEESRQENGGIREKPKNDKLFDN